MRQNGPLLLLLLGVRSHGPFNRPRNAYVYLRRRSRARIVKSTNHQIYLRVPPVRTVLCFFFFFIATRLARYTSINLKRTTSAATTKRANPFRLSSAACTIYIVLYNHHIIIFIITAKRQLCTGSRYF